MITNHDDWSAVETFGNNIRKSRYGVGYVRSVCAQFGAGLLETSPDEDTLGIDCKVDFREASVDVQVKCTTRQFNSDLEPYIRWDLDASWYPKWSRRLNPVYFVVVVVPDDPSIWINYDEEHQTHHSAAAYWVPIDKHPTSVPSSIQVHKSSRLTPDSLIAWREDLLNGFGGNP